jgi:hypothetical protein
VRLVADPSVDEADVRVDATFSDAPLSAPPPPPSIPIVRQPPTLQPERDVADVADAARPDGAAAAVARAAAPGDGPPARTAAPVAPAAPAAQAPAGIRADAHPRAAADAPEEARPDPAVLLKADVPAPDARPPRWLNADQSIPEPPPVAVPARRGTPAGLEHLDPTRTMIFEVPTVDAPLVVLREVAPDGSQRQLTLDGGPVTIGRATDNNLVLRDSRVSRYHGRLAPRQGALVYRDLGSTNGSRVNGVEIDEVVLGAGDRIELGDTVLVVESVTGG